MMPGIVTLLTARDSVIAGLYLLFMNPKKRAAEAAIPFLRDGMTIGLGTGSTADFFLLALAAAIQSGQLKAIRGVPTSHACEKRAGELRIALTTLLESPSLDVTVDGADEVDPNLDLIKGLGGALIRERIVAQASRQLIIIADTSKRVTRLGTRSPLPVEVVPFSHEVQPVFFKSLGATPALRMADGKPFITDNGNVIYDCTFPGGMDHPATTERQLHNRAGVVGTGLFLGMATHVLVADENQVTRMDRKVKIEDRG
jgi:ribose 5-phosphate isomerase A